MKYLNLLLLLALFGCGGQERKATDSSKEDWKKEGYINSVQILLTNEFKLGEARGRGASSFLIKSKEDTLLCTAKHLLGKDMGITPEVPTDSFNLVLDYWKAYPRKNNLTDDIIKGVKLVNEEINDKDIILQECELTKPLNIQVLKPRFSKVETGEKLEIIGCEYVDENCFQKKFDATMYTYVEGKIFIRGLKRFDVSGFSGAPVIDKDGLVIGVISGGGDMNGKFFLLLEPITAVAEYLR